MGQFFNGNTGYINKDWRQDSRDQSRTVVKRKRERKEKREVLILGTRKAGKRGKRDPVILDFILDFWIFNIFGLYIGFLTHKVLE